MSTSFAFGPRVQTCQRSKPSATASRCPSGLPAASPRTRSSDVSCYFSTCYDATMPPDKAATSQDRINFRLQMIHFQLNFPQIPRRPFHSQSKLPPQPRFFSISQLKMPHLRLKTASAPRDIPQIRSQTRQPQSSSSQSQLKISRLQPLNALPKGCAVGPGSRNILLGSHLSRRSCTTDTPFGRSSASVSARARYTRFEASNRARTNAERFGCGVIPESENKLRLHPTGSINNHGGVNHG